ncbi:hypothetical protein [Nitrosomonas aestuarii]|uniref:hypothetical protein n=1 Tax=Nitrosomonas aestuarii TaxID=52441 RepID=UPI0015E62FCE|nr:hypothetical protein [Nitrosomonas aestuarii]
MLQEIVFVILFQADRQMKRAEWLRGLDQGSHFSGARKRPYLQEKAKAGQVWRVRL